MKINKKGLLTLTVFLAVVFATNLNPIKASAFSSTLYPSEKTVYNYSKMKKGDVFYEYEDDSPFLYRVVKPASKKSAKMEIEVEIAGIYENFDWSSNPLAYRDPNVLDLDIDVFNLEELAPFKVVGIGDNAFKGDLRIRSFSTVPSHNFRYIGKSAFEGCTNLREFSNVSDITSIKAKAFCGCSSLKKFTLNGNGLNRVGKKAFKDTKAKMKLVAYDMNDTQVTKVKKLFKKAGAKKLRIKRKS